MFDFNTTNLKKYSRIDWEDDCFAKANKLLINDYSKFCLKEKERKQSLKKYFVAFMLFESEKGNLEKIANLYDYAFINNKNLVLSLDEEKYPQVEVHGFGSKILLDMSYVLAEKIICDDSLFEKFVDYYRQNYNHTDLIFDAAIANNSSFEIIEGKTENEKYNETIDIILKNDTVIDEFIAAISKISSVQELLFYGVIYLKQLTVDWCLFPFHELDKLVYEELQTEIDKEQTDSNLFLSQKMDWTDDFLHSKPYYRYLEKKKKRLAEFCECLNEEELYDEIRDLAYTKCLDLDDPVINKIANNLNIAFAMQGGWSLSDEEIDEIIEAYYKDRILKILKQNFSCCSSINKIEASRCDDNANIENEMNAIIFSLVAKYYLLTAKNVLKSTYEYFSMDILRDKKIKEENYFSRLIEEQKKEIEAQNARYVKLQEENSRLKELAYRQLGSEDSLETHMISVLRKELARKEKFLRDVKDKLQERDQFIELLEMPNECTDTKTNIKYDLIWLQTKRYLFVCRDCEIFRKLKQLFPRSVFVQNNTKEVTYEKIDAVVYIINCISHSMFYKVKSGVEHLNIPKISVNYNNIDLILAEMERILKLENLA